MGYTWPMLRFSDFAHLPEIDDLVRQLVNETHGLVVVAGLDSRPALDPVAGYGPAFLPSGRATIFRVLVSELLDAHPRRHCVVVGEDRDVLHVPRRFRARIEFVQVRPPLSYDEAIRGLSGPRPGVLVIDRLTPDNLAAALDLARRGALVVGQLDTLYHGASVIRHLLEMGAPPAALADLRWVLSVQRLPLLCPICKQPATVSATQLAQLEGLGQRFPALAALQAPGDGGAFYAPGRCDTCRQTGRQGDVAAFDFFHLPPGADPQATPSRLPLTAYVWLLAQRGQLALADALEFDGDQLRRAHALLMGATRAAADTAAALERKTAELDTANRLLKQRTRELVSLEGMGQALITWSDLSELGARVVRVAVELCKADRAALYYVRSADWAQVLAAHGWPTAEIGFGLARDLVYAGLSEREPMPFLGPPPGIPVAADSAPSRAGLVEQLQSKIEALEAAQESIAQKERLERELELARQVQQSMLPRTFPSVPGLAFAAANAPARHVGGDFYDVIRLDGDRVGLVIADVSDKGMPAALYMALARSLLLAESRQFDSPAVVLARVNQLLLELGEQDMFVTVFYGVLDPASGRLVFARAGHDRPFLVRDGAVTTLGGQGMALGLFDNSLFHVSEEALPLRSGDRLVLYTDGLSDVVDGDGRMLDQGQLATLVLRHAARPPADFCRALFADLAAYQGSAPQFDDMAMVVAALE